MSVLEKDGIRQAVREVYGRAAETGCCGPTCCSGPAPDLSHKMGYTAEEMAAVPDGANLGLGCGNPQAIAALKTGEIVLDLGSGAGFDCFLAARQVGESGKRHRGGHDSGNAFQGSCATRQTTAIIMSNSVWAKLKICRWPITPSMLSCPTASSIYRRINHGSLLKHFAF